MSPTESPSEKEALRPLGAFEQLTHGYMRRSPFQHSLVAHMTGELSSEQVASALAVVRTAHPLVGARVAGAPGPGQAPVFLAGHTPIPVTLAEPGSTWQEVAAREQGDQIDDAAGPLMRAVVLDTGQGTTDLVLTFAHQSVDAAGALGLLHDLVAVLNGASLEPGSVPPTQEDALAALGPQEGAAAPDQPPTAPDPRMGRLLPVRPFDGTPSAVSSRVLDADLTASIVGAARAHGTTVQSVLTAVTVRVLLATGRDFVRVAIPLDLRRAAGVPDVVANRFLGTAVGFAADRSDDVWAVAREVAAHLKDQRAPSALQAAGAGLSTMAPFATADAEASYTASLSADVELSNLGVVALPTGERVGVSAVDGPLLDTRIAGQQVLGALTCNGELRMCNVSSEPVPGFLDAVAEGLRQACTTP